MNRVRCSWLVLALLATSGASPARGSELSLALVTNESRPTLILAQRTIERSWGPSEDSVYVERDIPEWRSEGVALSLSAAVPGLGQAYAGDTRRGLWFALAEATGWVVRAIHKNRGGDFRDAAAAFAGAPSDSTSSWSFTRWERATSRDASDLKALYAADRDAFFQLIGSDPQYGAGWNDPEGSRQYFQSLREISDDRLRVARTVEVGLWLNHLVAAVDALRAARTHDVPLLPRLGIHVKSGWRRGGPTFVASIERRF